MVVWYAPGPLRAARYASSAADSGQATNAVPSCAATAPRSSAAAMPAPSIIPPAAMIGSPASRSNNRVSAKVLSASSCEAGSKIPRWPPASMPCATIASMPAFLIASASSRLVAVAMRQIPRVRSADNGSAEGNPKWKLRLQVAPLPKASPASRDRRRSSCR